MRPRFFGIGVITSDASEGIVVVNQVNRLSPARSTTTSSINNNTAAEVAKDAGDALAARLELNLREYGTEIEKEHHAG